jgi:hypothetical protein
MNTKLQNWDYNVLDQDVNSILDYLQLILPIASGVILAIGGWIFSYFSNLINFRYEIKRDKNQRLKDTYLNINNLFFQFFEFVYNFINEAMDKYSNDKDFTEYELSKFSSDKLLKLTFIFNLITMEFPEIIFDESKYINDSNEIEKYYTILRSIKSKKQIGKYIDSTVNVSKIISQLSVQSNDLLNKMNNIIKIELKDFKNKKKIV